VLAFAGGAVDAHGLPEGCSGHSSSGFFVAAQRDEAPSLGRLDADVLRRLEREAADAIAEADAAGSGDEQHIQYLRTVQRQCRDELATRGV
jgi:hypothetical protein